MIRSGRRALALGALAACSVADAGLTVDSVWIPVPIDLAECPSLVDHRSADLYIGFDVNPGKPAMTSAPGTGLTIMGGAFYQEPSGYNGPRPEGWFKVFPCARWDSYLTIGEAVPLFSPEYPEPDPADWGTTLVAEWLASPGEPVVVEIDPAKFGDSRHYVRVARITGTPGTMSVAGELGVVYFPFPDMPTVPVSDSVTVPNCPGCWGSADLDGDGVVGSGDLGILLAAWGAAGSPADLDGDGVVGSGDLGILLAGWG